MAARSSNLVDEMSGVNIQMEGHVDVPPQSAKDLWESEALGRSPSHLPSWSLGRRPLSNHPNTKHCLEISVTLTEELGAVPPSSHSWSRYMGWKSAYLTTDPMTIQEGGWAMAQAITDCQLKARGPGHPM